MNRGKTIALVLVRFLGFKPGQPRTRFGKYARSSERAIGIVALLYAALLCFPQVLFAHNVSAKGVTIYSRAALPPETTARIDDAVALFSKSELAVPGRTERIFICNNPWLYRLFYPLHRTEFAVSFPVTDNVFVFDADLVRDVSRSSATVHNLRTFSSVAAHEITHGLVRHRVGVIRGMFLRGWVSEGYCDYVARESSFPEDAGIRDFREGREEASPSFQYFVYRQMVRHLVEERHYSFDEVVQRAGDRDAIKAETIAAIKERAVR